MGLKYYGVKPDSDDYRLIDRINHGGKEWLVFAERDTTKRTLKVKAIINGVSSVKANYFLTWNGETLPKNKDGMILYAYNRHLYNSIVSLLNDLKLIKKRPEKEWTKKGSFVHKGETIEVSHNMSKDAEWENLKISTSRGNLYLGWNGDRWARSKDYLIFEENYDFNDIYCFLTLWD